MVGLGDLPGGFFDGEAFGVSGDGSVVVGQSNASGGLVEAFRWTSSGGMERLWDVLLARGVDPAASGWTRLSSANGVSLDGNTIVGDGFHNGSFEAFVAVIPQPVPGDVNGDGTVDVNDLLAVIASWGPCKAPCPADIAPFPEGDGVVDVNDLLAVIVHWD